MEVVIVIFALRVDGNIALAQRGGYIGYFKNEDC